MTAKILNGKEISQRIRDDLKERISRLAVKPHLAVILAGNDEASLIYDRNKKKAAEEIGMVCTIHHLPEDVSMAEIIQLTDELNEASDVHGIIVQMPLPPQLDGDEILRLISPVKDVDGFGVLNAGLLQMKSSEAVVAATPKGILCLLKSVYPDLSGKHAVIIGRSNIVGRPLASLLLNQNCTVTVTHSKTKDIAHLAKQADILVAACGCPKMVKKDWVKPGALVIDVGINRIGGKLCGDVDFDAVSEIAGYITPVPGGVGPMTIAMLLENTYEAAQKQQLK